MKIDYLTLPSTSSPQIVASSISMGRDIDMTPEEGVGYGLSSRLVDLRGPSLY